MASPPTDPKSASAPAAPESTPAKGDAPQASPQDPANKRPCEIGGPTGPEPTRYGDWERNGRVSDF